jgi:hypothetical protein
MRPGHSGADAERREHVREPAAQLAQLGRRVGDAELRGGGELKRGAVRLGGGAAAHVLGQRRQHLVGARVERPRARLEQHHLLLDADRPRRIAPGVAPVRPVRVAHAARTTERSP